MLTSGQGDPLLARWQQGLGQVLVWTSDLGGRWAIDWARWPVFAKLWGQVARSALRRGAAHHASMRTRLRGDRLVAQVDAFTNEDRPLTDFRGEVEITDVRGGDAQLPAAATRRVPLHERSAGRYEAEVPLEQSSALLLTARLRADGEPAPVVEARGRFAVPPSRELMPGDPRPPRGWSACRALAARGGGRADRRPGAHCRRGPGRVARCGRRSRRCGPAAAAADSY